MTDSTGLIQHAIYGVPRRTSGYTTDDNARALRLCARLWGRQPGKRMLCRVTKYLSFLEYAYTPGGGFHNFMSYRRNWQDAEGSGDCLGQAILALAEVLGSRLPEDHRALARELIDKVRPTLASVRSLRAQAYLILAWGHLRATDINEAELLEAAARSAAWALVECNRRARQPDWPWFEPRLTYANAVLPHALFVAARHWPDEEFGDLADASFAFLDRTTTADGVFWPVGNGGWYPRGGKKALYDQQPLEAATMADAALAAFDLWNDEQHLATFRRAYNWFHGQNSLGQPLVEAARGGCYDGLLPSGVNRNQGAESTIAYLWTETRNLTARHASGNGALAVASAVCRDARPTHT
jgi:hypothetical protein